MADYCIAYNTVYLVMAVVAVFIIVRWYMRRLTVDGYSERYVLVTGCDSGFGKLLAIRLDILGFNVFAGCLTEKGCSNLQTNGSDRLQPFLLNITKTEDIENAKKMVQEKLPPDTGLWALVNNAGILGKIGFPDTLKKEYYEEILGVNLYGLIAMSNAFLPLLRKAQGRIVNVSSVLGRAVIPTVTPYCISKYAVQAYSDGLRSGEPC